MCLEGENFLHAYLQEKLVLLIVRTGLWRSMLLPGSRSHPSGVQAQPGWGTLLGSVLGALTGRVYTALSLEPWVICASAAWTDDIR